MVSATLRKKRVDERRGIPEITTDNFLAARLHLFPVERGHDGLEQQVYCSPLMSMGSSQAHWSYVLTERDVPVMHFRFDGERWVYQGAGWL